MKKLIKSNPTRIPFVIGLILVVLSTGLWVQSFSSASNDLMQDTRNQASQTSYDIEKEIENKIDIIQKILLVEWLNVNNSEQLFDEDRFYELIPAFYDFYSGYLSINLVTANGTVLYVYPLEPNSQLINQSILYNVDGEPNLTIRKANDTNQTALSTFVTFYQGGSGLSSYIPFFDQGTLVGYFNVVFRTAPLFESYVDSHKLLTRYSFVIKENSTSVFRHNEDFDLTSKYVEIQPINYYDRIWTLYIIPSDDLIYQSSPVSHIAILVAGLTSAVLVVLLSKYLVRLNVLQEEKYREKERYEQLLQRLDKMNSLGTMSGGMAHDFNNLLMIIQGNISLLEQKLGENTDKEDQESLASIKLALKDGRELTQQILSFSRHQTIENEQTDLIDLVEERLELFESSLEHPVEIIYQTKLQEAIVYGNATRIGQILFNLLNNSVQAKSGTITVSLERATGQEHQVDNSMNHVVLRVEDTGTGIPETVKDKIFDPFFTTKKIGQGTGLGLAVAYRYISTIEGYMQVESTVGQGTTISIILPLLDPDDYSVTADEEIKSIEDNCKSLMNEQFGEEPSLLIIEDENYIARVIESMYNNLGCKVVHHDNGAEALQHYLDHRDYDMIILDVNLPGMNGVEIFRHIMERTTDQYIMFVTGFAEELSLIDIDQYDTVSLLTKPFSQKRLYQSTIRLLSAR